ncbi:MAG: aspartate aminotransferase family protein [Thiomonas sp. 14-64-326]|jgi:glutamate-1-semialdehyde 2,1-aminomutase|uniref:aspartate aminotransferase family protein n=1 Tax=Thiomonas sp. TaxID=2047785 RepID=UPI000BDA3816|nr:aspartate aminotransferase family protein [Thiomonas sp.]OZB72708.1 MAG: aspartate aminotransferase family protein [Thiomonas sp. 14-64-326]
MSPTSLPADCVARFHAIEAARFLAAHPRCVALHQQAQRHFLFGVPLHWMADAPSPVPLYVDKAQGARLFDVDGHAIIDFCLGDTGAMFGHSPAAIARTLAEHGAFGATTMLPSTVALEVADLLERRFGLPMWQFTATASDANRFVLRWARALTGRQHIVVFNGCYHGTVDDVFVDLDAQGAAHTRPSLLGQVHDLAAFTRVVEFNDLDGLRAALAAGDVACVLTEPVLTNIGMVLPEPGFLQALRVLTREHGALLVMDETHTLSCGPGGYCRANDLQPDVLILGKPIAGGTPGAAYGFTTEVGARMQAVKTASPPGHSGIGTTLSAGLLTLRLMRTMLAEVMTEAAYAQMFAIANRVADGLERVIANHGLRWTVTRIGARCEVQFAPQRPHNGSEARAAFDDALEPALQLALLNRGVLLTPFHNMLLASPAHTQADADALINAFDDALTGLKNA